jgi:cytochrome c oxidase assembly factor CtaG/cytochrome c2
VVLPILGLGGFYALAVNNAWAVAGRGRVVAAWQPPVFYGGVAALVLALVSPLDPLASVLFSAHMVQHVLLMMVAAPLLALGAPAHLWLWALPLAWRRGLARWWRRHGGLRPAARVLGSALVIWLLSTFILWVWHAPSLYEAALADDTLHALEHAAFLGTAWLFWNAVFTLARGQGAGDGVAILLLFTTALQSGILGALITFASSPWYAAYSLTTAAWGLNPLEDQQLAGVIMWVPAGTIYLAATLAILWLRLAALEKRAAAPPVTPPARATAAPPALGLLLLCAAALLLSGCSTPALGQNAMSPVPSVPRGDPLAGAVALRAYGCGACHNIPGIVGAHSAVGPPLDRWAERHYIAGTLLNTPDNLIRWIMDPQAIEPGTAMPDLGVTPEEAAHMSAYLYTLRR